MFSSSKQTSQIVLNQTSVISFLQKHLIKNPNVKHACEGFASTATQTVPQHLRWSLWNGFSDGRVVMVVLTALR